MWQRQLHTKTWNAHVTYMYMYSGAPQLSLYKDTSEMKTSP